MASDSINIDFNVGNSSNTNNNELVNSIQQLTKQLSGFESAVNKLTTSANTYQKAKSHLTPEVSKARAEANQQRHIANQDKYKYLKYLSSPASRNFEKYKLDAEIKKQKYVADAVRQKYKYEMSDEARDKRKDKLASIRANDRLAKTRIDSINAKSEALKQKNILDKSSRLDITKQFLKRTSGTTKATLERNASKLDTAIGIQKERNIPHLLKQTNIDFLKEQAKKAGDRGDLKTQKEYNLRIADIALGTKKGVTDGFKAIGTMYAAKLISGGIIRNSALSGRMTQSAMTNPLLNYDYGSPISSILSMQSQQRTGNVTTGLALAGGIIGGAPGAIAGDMIGNMIGASVNSKAYAQNQAIGELINQSSITSSLQGTNSASYNILKGRKGFTPYSSVSELDVTKPFATEFSKGASVYNKNFDAIDKMTQYAISAQIPLAKMGAFGEAIGQLRPNSAQFDKLTGLASSSGIDATSLANRTIAFMQGGLGKDSAMNAAANSFQNVSGFQSAQLGYLQGGYLDRTQKNLLGKAFGLDMEGIAKNDPNSIAKLRKFQEVASSNFSGGSNSLNQGVLDMLGLNQSTYNINSPQSIKPTTSRNIPGIPQQGGIDMANQARQAAYEGKDFDMSKNMGGLITQITGTTTSLVGFDTEIKNAVSNLKNLNKEISKKVTSSTQKYGVYVPNSGATHSMLGNR